MRLNQKVDEKCLFFAEAIAIAEVLHPTDISESVLENSMGWVRHMEFVKISRVVFTTQTRIDHPNSYVSIVIHMKGEQVA